MELQKITIKVRDMIECVIRACVTPHGTVPQGGVQLFKLQVGIEGLSTLYKISNIDDERIVDYFVYQIYRYRQCIIEDRWSLEWMTSQTAYDKFRNQFLVPGAKSGMNYYIDNWLAEGGLTRSDLVHMIEEPRQNPLTKLLFMASEEPIKKRFLNMETGLSLCTSVTTGWSPYSPTCQSCKFAAACENISSSKYPELIRLRKFNYGKEK